jgi:DNA-binding MarR family transcriptional regulator
MQPERAAATTVREGQQMPTERVPVLAWLRLVRVFDKVNRASTEHLSCWGLSVAQFDVLAHVGANEGLTQRELADSLLVTKGNITQLLDRMERCGWIVRRQEGRCNRLFLTPRGRDLFDRAVPAQEALIAAKLATLTPAEQVHLLRLLRKLDRALG